MSTGEVACSYAALILKDDGIPITAEKIVTLLKSANVQVESYWPSLFAKLPEKNIGDLIMNAVGSGPAPVAMATPAAARAAAPAVEEKKEEPEEDSDDDMPIFDLFN